MSAFTMVWLAGALLAFGDAGRQVRKINSSLEEQLGTKKGPHLVLLLVLMVWPIWFLWRIADE